MCSVVYLLLIPIPGALLEMREHLMIQLERWRVCLLMNMAGVNCSYFPVINQFLARMNFFILVELSY